MNLLNDLILENKVKEVEKLLDSTIDAYEKAVNEVVGNPAVKQTPGMNQIQALQIMSQRFEAAIRGLALANKLPPGPEQKQQRSRVMSNLNMINHQLQKLISQNDNDGGVFGRSMMSTQGVPNIHQPRV